MDTAATCSFEYTLECVLYMAIELDNNRWKLGFTTGFGQRPRERDVAARDTEALQREIRTAKRRFHLPEDCPVLTCYEAGREGFWLHRYLIHTGTPNLVVDAGSMEARKKRRRAKTDRIDMEKLLRMLIRYHAGDEAVWSVVRVPGTGAEDRRQLHRERWALSSERNKHVKRKDLPLIPEFDEILGVVTISNQEGQSPVGPFRSRAKPMRGRLRLVIVEEANRAKIKVTLLTSVVILLASLIVTIVPTLILLTREGVIENELGSRRLTLPLTFRGSWIAQGHIDVRHKTKASMSCHSLL
ncbi:MAG: hypothetical protein P1P76_11695 [Anaerolineales bacterium]|nr:hypothetical protein [Anaerolineales bacterium]